jgi:hypothetical protein
MSERRRPALVGRKTALAGCARMPDKRGINFRTLQRETATGYAVDGGARLDQLVVRSNGSMGRVFGRSCRDAAQGRQGAGACIARRHAADKERTGSCRVGLRRLPRAAAPDVGVLESGVAVAAVCASMFLRCGAISVYGEIGTEALGGGVRRDRADIRMTAVDLYCPRRRNAI